MPGDVGERITNASPGQVRQDVLTNDEVIFVPGAEVGYRRLKTTFVCLLRPTERIVEAYESETIEIFSKTHDV